MYYSVSELAKVSGVSVRALHYYDEIGLLKPCYINEAGYRFYNQKQLLLLQQILFYKELGFELKQIKTILTDPNFDVITSLKSQKQLLADKRAKTDQLINTLEKTITYLERQKIMQEQELFWGFSKEKQAAYEKEMIEKYGPEIEEHINQSYKNMKNWTKADWDQIKQEADNINRDLVVLLLNNVSVDDKQVQLVIARHYQWTCKFWQPNALSYAGLADLYTQHPDFKKLYDGYHKNLADYLAAGMKLFAQKNLP